MASVQTTIRRFYSDKAKKDSQPLPTPATRREPSKNEQDAEYKAPIVRQLFCFHGKTIFEPCSNCNRSKQFANRTLNRTLSAFNIPRQ